MARAFDSFQQGLNEAIGHAQSQGKEVAGIKVYQPQSLGGIAGIAVKGTQQKSPNHCQFGLFHFS